RQTTARPPGHAPPRPRTDALLHSTPPIRIHSDSNPTLPRNARKEPRRTTQKTDGRLPTTARPCRGALPGVPVRRGYRVVPAFLCTNGSKQAPSSHIAIPQRVTPPSRIATAEFSR